MGNESATEATAKFKFKFMDQNKDGFLDLKEFTDACADMDTATIEGFIAKLYISYSMGARTIYLSVDIEFRYGVKPSHPSAPALGLRRGQAPASQGRRPPRARLRGGRRR